MYFLPYSCIRQTIFMQKVAKKKNPNIACARQPASAVLGIESAKNKKIFVNNIATVLLCLAHPGGLVGSHPSCRTTAAATTLVSRYKVSVDRNACACFCGSFNFALLVFWALHIYNWCTCCCCYLCCCSAAVVYLCI